MLVKRVLMCKQAEKIGKWVTRSCEISHISIITSPHPCSLSLLIYGVPASMFRGLVSTLRPSSRLLIRPFFFKQTPKPPTEEAKQTPPNFSDFMKKAPKMPTDDDDSSQKSSDPKAEEDHFNRKTPQPAADGEPEEKLTPEEMEEAFSSEVIDNDKISGYHGHKDLPGGHIRYFMGDFHGNGEPIDSSKFRITVPDMLLKMVKFTPQTGSYDIVDIHSSQYFNESRKVVLGIVGAFFPETSSTFLYDWARASNAFKKQFYYDEVVITSVNDAYVMKTFAEKLGYRGRFSFLADWNGEFTRALDLEVEDKEAISALGSRGVLYTSSIINSKVHVVNQSDASGFEYTAGVSPGYFWRLCKKPKTSPRVFL